MFLPKNTNFLGVKSEFNVQRMPQPQGLSSQKNLRNPRQLITTARSSQKEPCLRRPSIPEQIEQRVFRLLREANPMAPRPILTENFCTNPILV